MLRKAHFTLIEIMMALAVLSVGMVAILGAFAIGFKANSDVIAEGMADEAAKNIMAWIKYNKASVINAVNPITGTVYPAPPEPGAVKLKPSSSVTLATAEDNGQWLSPENWTGKVSLREFPTDSTRPWFYYSMPFSAGSILKKLDSSGSYHVYKVIRYRDSKNYASTPYNDLGGYGKEPFFQQSTDNLEFEANAVAWISELTPGSVTPSSVVKVTIEVSWPVSLPYDQRKKYTYIEEF